MSNVNVSYDMDGFMSSANNLALRQGGDINYVKLDKDKTVTVRFLPPPTDHPQFKRAELFLLLNKHFGYMGPNGKVKVISCTRPQHQVCPICSMYESLMAENSKKRASEIRVQHKFAYTVLDAQNRMSILELDPKCQAALINTFSAYRHRDPHFIPYHLQNGHWVDIRKTKENVPSKGQFQSNIYTITLHIKPTAVDESILNNYSTNFVWPEKSLTVYTPQEVQMAMNGDWSFLSKYGSTDDATDFSVNEYEAEAAAARKHNSHVSQQPPASVPAESAGYKRSDLAGYRAAPQEVRPATEMLSLDAQKRMMNDILND